MKTRSYLSILLFAWAGLALADFVPDDELVSDPASDLPQPEFDRATNRIITRIGGLEDMAGLTASEWSAGRVQ